MAADPKALQNHAVQAEKHLEALATGLGQAGAPENVVKAVTQCADVARQVVQTLGDVRAEQPPPGQPPEQEAPPEQAPPEQGDPIGGAARELQGEVAAKAAARRSAGTS